MIDSSQRSNSSSTNWISNAGSPVPLELVYRCYLSEPEASMTCMRTSACLASSRNLLPSPLPACAPGTRPATSTSRQWMNLLPSMHTEWTGLSYTKLSTDTFCSSISYTYIGLDCCKGIVCYRNCKVQLLKKVDLPTLALPIKPIIMYVSLWLIPPLMSSFEI